VFALDRPQQISPGAEVIAGCGVVALPAASLICRLDTAYMPRSANNRSAADRIASRVPVDRSLRRTLAAVTDSVNTRT
jgi:hypothetical protein